MFLSRTAVIAAFVSFCLISPNCSQADTSAEEKAEQDQAAAKEFEFRANLLAEALGMTLDSAAVLVSEIAPALPCYQTHQPTCGGTCSGTKVCRPKSGSTRECSCQPSN